ARARQAPPRGPPLPFLAYLLPPIAPPGFARRSGARAKVITLRRCPVAERLPAGAVYPSTLAIRRPWRDGLLNCLLVYWAADAAIGRSSRVGCGRGPARAPS